MDTSIYVINKEDCIQILKNVHQNEDVEFLSLNIRPLSEEIEGFLGTHYIIVLEYKQNDENKSKRFFMKTLSEENKVSYEMATCIGGYSREELFYKNLSVIFEKHNIDLSFAPKGYFCKPELFVLEDLSLRRFKMVPKTEMFNFEHMCKALECLAKFHATSIIYEEKKSKILGRPFRIFEDYGDVLEEKYLCNGDSFLLTYLRNSVKGILAMIDQIPECEGSKESFKSKVLGEFEKVLASSKPSKKYRNTLCHGDLWTNNFMFQYEGDSPSRAILIDYQFLKYFPPGADVVQMIILDSRKVLRDAHYTEFLHLYYENLQDILKGHSIDASVVLPEEEFLASCSEYEIRARLHSIADRSITFMSSEVIMSACKDYESTREFVLDRRSEYIIKSFVNDKEFRELITEDILELRNLLLK